MKEVSRQLSRRTLPALQVHQWLREWDKVKWDKSAWRRRPEPVFYLFSIDAELLRKLSGIYRRSAAEGTPRATDPGIQRRHEAKRSRQIGEFIKYGYPWSELDAGEREDPSNRTLRKPGWLATAIVVNILTAGEARPRGKLLRENAVRVKPDDDGGARIVLPETVFKDDWDPDVPPLEVIDGQHRLWAFERRSAVKGYELPVVAFAHLDRSWQAYLFWVINIKPTRINPSLAFDLYPLLRAEDWLERPAEHDVYRKTRAQELVEAIWAHPTSPWHNRINMLGEPGLGPIVSQSAWVHSLTTTFVKASSGRGVRIGGLYGGPIRKHEELQWNRSQQAAFLIRLWQAVHREVGETKAPWAKQLRSEKSSVGGDLAFYGPHTLLSSDQGVRAVLSIANALCYLNAARLKLGSWEFELDPEVDEPIGKIALTQALASLEKQSSAAFLDRIASALATYDWRRLSAPDLTERQQLERAGFRGSGGYRLLREQVLKHMRRADRRLAKLVAEALPQAD